MVTVGGNFDLQDQSSQPRDRQPPFVQLLDKRSQGCITSERVELNDQLSGMQIQASRAHDIAAHQGSYLQLGVVLSQRRPEILDQVEGQELDPSHQVDYPLTVSSFGCGHGLTLLPLSM